MIFASLGFNPGIRLNGLCWWWLRSPGNNQNNAANVNNDGSVNSNGNNVNNDNDCVRPALLPNGEKSVACASVGVGSKGIEFLLEEIRENTCRRKDLTHSHYVFDLYGEWLLARRRSFIPPMIFYL